MEDDSSSANNSLTVLIIAIKFLLDKSTTCNMKFENWVSSSVARNELTSWCGSFWMNPTVSVIMISSLILGSFIFLVVGSKVANSLSSAKTLDLLIRFNKVDFPALVYPMMVPVKNGVFCLFFLATALFCLIFFNFVLMYFILDSIWRLSDSNWVSPGPLVPIPPAKRDKCNQSLLNLDLRYSNWANSTCRCASNVFALVAKISKIKPVLSRILMFNSFSRFLYWAGVSSSSAIHTLISFSLIKSIISSIFPEPK